MAKDNKKLSKADVARIKKQIAAISKVQGQDIEASLRENSQTVLAASVALDLQFPLFMKQFLKIGKPKNDEERKSQMQFETVLKHTASYFYGMGMKHDQNIATILSALDAK